MIILVDIGHPAHVHLFKNLIWSLKKKGHEVYITARDKEIVLQLLNNYKFDYTLISRSKKGLLNFGKEMIQRNYNLFNIVRKIHPYLMISVLDPSITQIGKLLNVPTITFTDSEPEAIKYPILDLITTPFTDVILTLSSVRHDYGKKEVRVNSYKELAYLHPNWFTPNPAILDNLGLKTGEEFVLLRFVAWEAYHDVDREGFDTQAKKTLIERIEPYARVFISSESKLPEEFEPYLIPILPEQMHDFLYYAKLLVSDSQTMTTEAAVLGTPAIRYNSFVGSKDMGNFVELEEKYGLIFNFKDAKLAIEKAVELVRKAGLKEEWQRKREVVLMDKSDLSTFIIWFIENYPRSFTEMKEHPEMQYSRASALGDTL